MAKEFRIQTISVCDTIRIHCLSCIFGVWVIFKRLAKGVWNSQRLTNIQPRDNPPSCLVDSRLGQHKYVKLKGEKFHYVESGSKERPLILLLHGFPDFWLSWRYQIPVLSQHFRVVALDLKGFGDSDKPVWRSRYQINRILEEIKDFIHALGVSNCIIIGHDLGALIGWYLVHQTPELVNKFFAVSCPHPNVYWQNLSNTCNYQWLNFVQVPYLPEIDALKEDVKIIDQYYKHLAPNDVYLEAYKYAFSRKDDWTGPINYYRKLPFLRINEGAGNISTTVILITGNKDQLVKLEGIVKSTEYCDKFYLKMIDGTEHFPHQEDPENFNKVILQFLIGKSTSVEKDMLQRSSSKRIMQGLLGAVSTTVKYGNSVIDNVQKKTNCVVSSIPIGLSLNYNQATSK
nr:epoxide hydrolase 4-like [Leptinotarsa decemlineata]